MNITTIYKQIIAIVFLAALFAHNFSNTLIIADYYTNTASYAKKCVNKARPQLKCNGKCQMTQKLKQQEKQDTENPERKLENRNEILLSSKSFFAVVNLPAFSLFSSDKIFPHSDGVTIHRCSDIFRPPKLV